MPEDPVGGRSTEPETAELAATSVSDPDTLSQYETGSPSDTSLRNRFRAALCIYAVLAVLAWFTLDGRVRDATLLILGGIAFKSWLGVLKDRQS